MPEEAVILDEETPSETEGLAEETPEEVSPEGETETPETPEGEEEKEEEVKPLVKGDLKVALKEERKRRQELGKELEKKTKESEERIAKVREEAAAREAKVNERLEILARAMQIAQAPPVQEEIPLYEEDPVGYLKYHQEKQEREQRELKQTAEQQAEANRIQSEVNRVIGTYQSQCHRFAQEKPDFNAAYNYMVAFRRKELELLGHTDPQKREEAIVRDEFQLAAEAEKRGINPAVWIYELAKHRGYKPAAADPPLAAKLPANLDKEKAAAAAGKSLGTVAGSPSLPLTAEALVSMGEAEFAEATKGDNWKKLFVKT